MAMLRRILGWTQRDTPPALTIAIEALLLALMRIATQGRFAGRRLGSGNIACQR